MKHRIKLLVSISFIILTTSLLGQNLCLKLDSVIINSVPWELNSMISWSDYEVRKAPSTILKTLVVKDEKSLNSLSNLNLELDNATNYESIDVRMVLDFYFGNEKITLTMDSDRYYSFLGRIYPRNMGLITWIDDRVSSDKK